nr:transposase [Geminicoccus roseus]
MAFSGRQQHPGPPASGRCCSKRGGGTRRPAGEAPGRSRGGHGTKACVIADGSGRAVAFSLAPGQAREPPQAIGLLERLPGVPRRVVADHGYASHALRGRV